MPMASPCSSSTAMLQARWCTATCLIPGIATPGAPTRPGSARPRHGRAMTRGIFFRHVLREILASTLLVAVVLLVVLATYQLSFVMGRAADGQVAGAMVPELALLALRTSLTVILPLS